MDFPFDLCILEGNPGTCKRITSIKTRIKTIRSKEVKIMAETGKRITSIKTRIKTLNDYSYILQLHLCKRITSIKTRIKTLP